MKQKDNNNEMRNFRIHDELCVYIKQIMGLQHCRKNEERKQVFMNQYKNLMGYGYDTMAQLCFLKK